MTRIHEVMEKLGAPARERLHGWLLEKLATATDSAAERSLNAPPARQTRWNLTAEGRKAANGSRVRIKRPMHIDRDNLLLLLRSQKEPFTVKQIQATLMEKGYLVDRIPQTIYEWEKLTGYLQKGPKIQSGKRQLNSYQLTQKGEERAATLGS